MISAQAFPALVETGSKVDPIAPSGFVELDEVSALRVFDVVAWIEGKDRLTTTAL